MKYLSEYINEAQSACFKKYGVFFAFSQKQLDEQKKDGVTYVSLGMGMLCPQDNVDAYIKDHVNIIKNGIKQDIAENGIDNIIVRELDNHEYCITYDIQPTVDALDGYGITAKMVEKVARSASYRERIAEYM